MIKVYINYEFDIDLDANSNEDLDIKFDKFRKIVEEDTEKFIMSNIDSSNVSKKILFELVE